MNKDKPSTNLMENKKLAIELYEAYEKLSENKDFQTLIEKGFLDTFAKNQVGLLATVPDSEKAKVDYALLGVSILEKWLLTVEILGGNAKRVEEIGEYTDMVAAEVPDLEDELG